MNNLRYEPWHKIAVSVMGLLALAALALMLFGCNHDEEDTFPYTSPAGHEFGIEGALDPAVVGPELDLRVLEWKATHADLNPVYLDYVSHRTKFYVIDAPRFATMASPTGYARGHYDMTAMVITLAWQTEPLLACATWELNNALFYTVEDW